MGGHKRIGILTSGGDCAGLNPVIRAVVQRAVGTYGWEVLGIRQATLGLMANPANVWPLDPKTVNSWLTVGGTMLGTTNTGNPFAFPMSDGTLRDRSEDIIQGYHQLGLDAIIGIGGDGSMAILRQLAQQGGWNLVGIPKTIDNDVGITERSIGFDTAVNTITDALNRLTFTAASHDRVMIVEVMGRSCGHLALHTGIAGGADVILLPEIPYSILNVCRTLTELRDRWKRKFAIVVVAEGAKTTNEGLTCDSTVSSPVPLCGVGQYIADQISRFSTTPIDTRVSVLGHIQRGGIPSALDRLVATSFGKAAIDLVAREQFGQMVAWQNGQVVAVPLTEVLAHSPLPVDANGYLVQTARCLGIYVGDVST